MISRQNYPSSALSSPCTEQNSVHSNTSNAPNNIQQCMNDVTRNNVLDQMESITVETDNTWERERPSQVKFNELGTLPPALPPKPKDYVRSKSKEMPTLYPHNIENQTIIGSTRYNSNDATKGNHTFLITFKNRK